VGEPGIGKTTLLESARSLADGFTRLSAQGLEPDSALAHAGLLELVTPIRPLLDDIPIPQADALCAALGWATPVEPADRFLVAAATLSLLAAAADRAPVLVTVDDLQWLDRESAAAILFAARRLGPDAVAFVFSARSGSISADLVKAIPVLELDGLSPADASRLVPEPTQAVLEQLVAGTDGNPLALLEASRRLTQAQSLGAAPLPDPLPVGDRLLGYYETLLTTMSVDAWRAVVLLAVDQNTGSSTVAAALSSDGIDPGDALDEARIQDVVVADERGMRFRHPLLRTAVLRLATPAQQREAHQALADELPPDSPARIWHLAESCVGPDDAMADELVRVADADRRRLGFAAASAAMERAARLTRSGDRAAEHLSAAAEDAFLAGDVSRTRELVDRVLGAPAPAAARGRALYTLGMLEQYAGSMSRSADHLAGASDLLDGRLLAHGLTELANVRFRLNDIEGIDACADRLDLVADRTDPEQRLLADFTRGVLLMLRGESVAGRAKLAVVRDLALSEELRHEPRALLYMALAVGFSGEVGNALTEGSARIDEVRRQGAVGILVPLLAIRAAGRAGMAGDHAGAFADAGEAAELADQLGYVADASVAVEMLAWQLSARGLHDETREALAKARELVDRAGTIGVAAHHALTVAFCALCRGDLATVVDVLEPRIAFDGGVGSLGEPLGVAPLLVEAYAGLGRTAEASELSRRFAQVTNDSAPARIRALVARCQGITASGPKAARSAYEIALATHAVDADRFETARTRMLFGARLRRDGQRVAAREQLRLAHDAFVEMDLTHWARESAHELSATGATARKRGDASDEALTSQETRVALLVAEGKSNKEVAAALFLSPKTIEHHLGSVFRKRGYKSRSELASAFARLPDQGTS
jgi:DNA-binding CsgD family transcriptional regulator